MKYTTLALLILLSSIVNLEAQQLVELCRDDKVAAVISQMNGPCEFKTDRKPETKKSALSPKDDLHRKLGEGAQLQCHNSADKKSKKADEGCMKLYLCGSRQDKPVTTVDPDWLTVVNVPDVLPRGDTRPGSNAMVYPSNFLMLPSTPGISHTAVAAYAFRPENPETGTGKIGFWLDVDRELVAGNHARDRGEFLVAEAHYRKAVTQNPTDPRPLVGLGNIYTDLGRWSEAELAYRRAMESNPSLDSAYSSLSYVLLQNSPDIGHFVGYDARLEKAEAFARQAIKLQPKSAAAYDLLAVILEKQGTLLNEAEGLYKQALQIKPNSPMTHLHLSRLLRTLDRDAEAERHYSLALSLTDPPTLMLLAERFQSEGLFRLSEAPLDLVLKAEPDNALALYLLSRALVYRTEYVAGVKLLKRVSPALVYRSGSVAAVALLKGVSQSDPVRFEAQRLLGFSYLKMNLPEEAEKAFGSAAENASPEQRKLLVGRSGLGGVAELYLNLKRLRDAERVYATAFSLDPGTPLREAAGKH